MPTNTKFKVLAADKLAKQGLEFIQSQADAELVNKPGLSEDELAAIVGEHDAMIVRSGVTVTAKVLENPGRLKVIARAGVGVDNIDLAAATAKGILVVNTAEANTITTAEHAFALMLAMARNIGPAYKTMNAGGWDRSKFQGRQMAGKTLGIVGFGRIGQAIAERALAFEMDVVAYDPFINAETMLDGRVKMFKDFTDMLPECDLATFHVPLNDQTRGMLGKETWKLAKPGLMVINAARGGVIDEEDLIDALESGQCGGAALDVYTSEPPAEDSPLRTHPKVLVTPHLGA
ncbi:MAG: hydroxyacid dehydrogenase, partial [Phycisphaeraceae bacterium]